MNPEMGGAEVFTYENAKRWVEAGHDVTLFTSEFQNCRKEEVSSGIRIVRSGGKFSVYWRAKKYYGKYFSKEGYNVVIDEINTRPFFATKFVNKGEKIFALIHQLAKEYWFYEMPFPMSHVGYYFLEKKWLRNYVDVPTVTVSESTRRDLLDLGFKKVIVVTEGLNFKPLDTVPKKENCPVVAYVGRLKKAKRPDHVIKAFLIVKEKVANSELWIIGDGDFKKNLEKMDAHEVKFFRGLSDAKRRQFVKGAWILVNPSVREGFGLNVVEANALGTPCVAYDVPGLRDSIKNGETGLLAEEGSVEDLAHKIVMILKDDALRGKLSRNALSYSTRFDWDKCAEQFLEIFNGTASSALRSAAEE